MAQLLSATEHADRLERRRARVFPMLGILLITQQASFISTTSQVGTAMRDVDHLKVSAWAVLAIILLAMLMTGGGWLRGKEVRALMNDDVTRANRSAALATGFVVSVVTGVVCYLVAAYEPTDARVVAHVVVSTGLAGALLRFGALERRAQRGS